MFCCFGVQPGQWEERHTVRFQANLLFLQGFPLTVTPWNVGSTGNFPTESQLQHSGVSQLVRWYSIAPKNPTGSIPWLGKGLFSHCQLLVQTLVVFVKLLCVTECMICEHHKQSRTLAAGPLFGGMKMLHTMVGMCGFALADTVAVPM